LAKLEAKYSDNFFRTLCKCLIIKLAVYHQKNVVTQNRCKWATSNCNEEIREWNL